GRGRRGGAITLADLAVHVLNPRRRDDREYKKDRRGSALLSTGFKLAAREWARVGARVLGRVVYRGRQIVPEITLRQAFVGSPANPSYGLTFWLNRQAPIGREIDIENMLDLPWQRADWMNICICKDAPADMLV